MVLYREGGEAAADDAGAVLSVLARTDAAGRDAIEAAGGQDLLRQLLDREGLDSPNVGAGMGTGIGHGNEHS